MTIALAALFFLASCGKEEVGEKPHSIQGNIDDPAWQADTDYDYVGVAHCDDLGRFFLFIHAPSQPYGQITLRYYSHTLHNIFNTDTTFPFVNGGQQGTAAEPLLVPFWAVTQR